MKTELILNGDPNGAANYIGWSPVPAQIRLNDAADAAGPVNVTVRNQNTAQGGQLVFFDTLVGEGVADLTLTLPIDGSPVTFHVAGEFDRPSIDDKDAVIEAVEVGSGQVLSTTALMVRIRKDGEKLTTSERTRFCAALAKLNDPMNDRFQVFRDVHVQLSVDEAHGDRGFLPWHRAYLLDLERELQAIDPSVALHYWNPYNPAPKIFSRDFMGSTPQGFVASNVTFSATNPLRTWRVDSVDGILRSSTFNNQTGVPVILSEALTLQLGGNPAQYRPFRQDMEIDPHGDTHTSMRGSVSSLGTAAMDPLFFMLHANVDRIWAKWQFLFDRFDSTQDVSYGPLNPPRRIGHNLDDTMWPWNLVTGNPRPNQAPGGTFPPSPVSSAPVVSPTVRAFIDYQGVISLANRLGFDYDDVPFQFATN